MKTKLSIVGLSLVLAACGGGGGGGSTGGSPAASAGMTVTPSLGQFSAGTAYTVKKLDGTSVSSGVIGSNGKVTVAMNGYTGPVVVTVLGATGVTYWDEGTGTNVLFPAPNTLRAVVPSPMAEVGVTALTNAAAAKLDASGGIANATASTISDANNKVAAMFGLPSILTAPTPVNSTTLASLDLAAPGDKYALVLAALAKSASGGDNAMSVAASLAADLTDGKLDGQSGGSPISGTPVTSTAVAAAYQTMATTLATPTSALVAAAQPLVVTPDVTAVVAVSNQSDVTLAKAMFAELRTTLQSYFNGSKTGFLNTQLDGAKADLDANVAPNMERVFARINALGNAKKMFDDASAYNSATNTAGLTVGGTPPVMNGDPANNGSALTRQLGTWEAAWFGYGSFEYCWTGSETGLGGKVTCAAAGSQSADWANNRVKMIVYELTNNPSGVYSYTATRYNVPVTVTNGIVTPGVPVLVPSASVPTGAGTFSSVTSAGGTDFVLNGTMPPSASDAQGNLITGVDTVYLYGATSTVSSGVTRYLIKGSVSTPNKSTPSKVVDISLDTGTYIDVDEVNSTPSSKHVIAAKLIGTVATTNTKLTGSFNLTNWANYFQNTQNWHPTTIVFNGSITDTSSTVGQFLTGKLEANELNTANYNSLLDYSANNFTTGNMTFTGTVQAPNRPLLKLVIGAVRTGFSTRTATVNYSYGTKSITGSGSADDANPANDSMTLTNQDGIQMVTKTGIVSKSGTTVATVVNNMVNYVDGVTESLQ